MTLAEVDTPALAVDLDAVERNLARMLGYCREHGLAHWAHVKTHKSPELARRQLEAGAAGLVCQKLGEAEVMAGAGLGPILLTFPLVGPAKARRLAALAARGEVAVALDSERSALDLSRALAEAGARADVLVECDTGFGRTGVQSPRAAGALAEAVDGLAGLRFAGLMTHPTRRESGPWLGAARREIERRGLVVERISGGSTPTAFLTHEVEGIGEVRAGTYVYGDRACAADGTVPLADCALRVLATVVSRPTAQRVILDAGSKSLTTDPGPGDGLFGLVPELPSARLERLSEEHGHLRLAGSAGEPAVGTRVSVVPNHACGAVNLHDEVVVHRSGRVEGVWRVAARGKVR
jgi:D-serine deaminase-like pyridoxal phosphate-dependent protein